MDSGVRRNRFYRHIHDAPGHRTQTQHKRLGVHFDARFPLVNMPSYPRSIQFKTRLVAAGPHNSNPECILAVIDQNAPATTKNNSSMGSTRNLEPTSIPLVWNASGTQGILSHIWHRTPSTII
ncbi:uncharacterized protein ARMOST_20983 [Armillaria ostoyae]|uniref:Uncharacterized protein n=1 Tax=Armillaria ostoyae TaxID=47428 RepID=A0A284S8V1_ARMOS|nr:uncharacterized protein ARMOST_20983 [Armillaria ostoyae]